ncbi:Fur family transcriptional regulator [Desulfosporosinus sp. OT]|uniref:Fur family transcriptional regulator n=1 Tax=Desulfosporosinus sp. OT TaxID=913865 RepID=UPI000223A83E|nr:Fur family transcriptional regulator [Desulfosporosinus sp. OT]EGW41927.1 ferric uptake regulator family protein [Desulfosporosinus sp. OT]
MVEDLFEQACERLHNNDYKVTRQREIILYTFMANSARHLSAEDVFLLLKDQHSDIGLATVYRTLDILSELGVIHRNDFGDGKYRYEITNEDAHPHHHHLICLDCGSVAEFDDYLLESLEAQISKKNNFKVKYHNLKFYGYCQKCSEKT